MAWVDRTISCIASSTFMSPNRSLPSSAMAEPTSCMFTAMGGPPAA